MTHDRSILRPLFAAMALSACGLAACGVVAEEETAGTATQALASDGLRVLLEVDGPRPIAGRFKTMSGMDSETEAVALVKGYSISEGGVVVDWLLGGPGQQRSGTITVLDQDLSTVVASYRFTGGRLLALVGAVPGAAGAPMAIEKIEIANEKVERVLR